MGRNHESSSRHTSGLGGKGRGGRGKGKNKVDGSKNNAPKRKTELKDSVFKVGSARRSNECEENINYMLRHLTTALKGDTKNVRTYLEKGEVKMVMPGVNKIPYLVPKRGEEETPIMKRKNGNLGKAFDNRMMVYDEQVRLLDQTQAGGLRNIVQSV